MTFRLYINFILLIIILLIVWEKLNRCIIMENFIRSQSSVKTKDGYYQDTVLHVYLFWVHFANQSLTVLCSGYLFNNVCKGNSLETGFYTGAKRRPN